MTASPSNSFNDVITEISNKPTSDLIDSLKSTDFVQIKGNTVSKISKSSSKSNSNNYIKYILIILLLLFLGVNLFNYLGYTLDKLKELLAPILAYLGYKTGDVIDETVTQSQRGVKLATDVTGDSIKDAVGLLKNKSMNNEKSNKKNNYEQNLNKHQQKIKIVKPDLNTSEIQSPGKKFCYIGKDRGYRSCISMDNDDTCMSGDIFSELDICINPSLRE